MQVQFSLNLGADFHLGSSARDRRPAPEVVEAVPVSFIENDSESSRPDPDGEHRATMQARLLEQRAARQGQRRLPAPRRERKEARRPVPQAMIRPARIDSGGILTLAFTAGLDLGLPPALDVTV